MSYAGIVKPPQNQTVCEGENAIFTCTITCTTGTSCPAFWLGGTFTDASKLPGHIATDDSNGRSAPVNVTAVLTVINVSPSHNGTGYAYFQDVTHISDVAFLTVFGE